MDEKKNEQVNNRRRRGETLENAILQAAWDELTEVGYFHLTMEGVAARAMTNKTAVYRRWPNRAKLVVAVLQKHLEKPADDVPDTGSLRKDLMVVLGRITKPLQSIGAETIHGLMAEYLGHELFTSFSQKKYSQVNDKWSTIMMTILKNAEVRGEISLNRICPGVISLPVDLLQHRFLTSFEPVSDEKVEEIIDCIFLPLIHAQQNEKCQNLLKL